MKEEQKKEETFACGELTLPRSVLKNDSTKLSDFSTCERFNFYKHILGWRLNLENHNAVFGQSWHYTMEDSLELKGSVMEKFKQAPALMKRFLEHYRESYSPLSDAEYYPKDPGNAEKAIAEYLLKYGSDRFKVLFTEVAGSVHVDEDVKLYFKMDAVVEDDRGVFCLEHKTTGRDFVDYQRLWELAIQPGTYIHALSSVYSYDEVYGCVINLAIFRKGGNDFRRIPIRKSLSSMQAWLYTVNHLLKMFHWNLDVLSQAKESDDVLQAFPMRPSNCIQYGRLCPYFDYCCMWANPLQHREEVPVNMKVEHWDPEKKAIEDATFKLENGKIEKVERAKE